MRKALVDALTVWIYLTLKRGALIGKGFRQALHNLDNKLISPPDSLSGSSTNRL